MLDSFFVFRADFFDKEPGSNERRIGRKRLHVNKNVLTGRLAHGAQAVPVTVALYDAHRFLIDFQRNPK